MNLVAKIPDLANDNIWYNSEKKVKYNFQVEKVKLNVTGHLFFYRNIYELLKLCEPYTAV